MKIALIYTERNTLSLDRPFAYYIRDDQSVFEGTRVSINFHESYIVGYVEKVIESNLTRKEYEKENGFELKDIDYVIDEKPLLNDELQNLAKYLAFSTISPLISCYQALLPPSLKPTSAKKTDILYRKAVRLVNDRKDLVLTPKQQEFILTLKKHDILLSDCKPYIVEGLEKLGIVEKYNKEIFRNPLKDEYFEHKDDPKLTFDQQNVLNEFNNSNDKVYLLEGVTGSGKTEIYIQAAKRILNEGKNVLVIVPEISLTPQTIRRFKERFDLEMAIFHSKLSNGEKYDEYRRIRSGQVRIVVGARSACFAPLENIGLIIVDEEHSDSYQQEDIVCYNMINIALYRAKFHGAKVILGSATPSIESKTKANEGIYHQLYLNKRINNTPLPLVSIIEINRYNMGEKSLLSNFLINKINETINENKQVILLLNRRGYSYHLECSKCGNVFLCSNCKIPMHYHYSDNSLKCHYCGNSIKLYERCPLCGNESKYFRHVGAGSQKLEEELKQKIPNGKIIRLDLDTTRKKDSLKKPLSDFENKKYNIMIGTQIVAKGLDFKDVDLVGIVNADTTLFDSDFRSQEKTYQLITQMIGRSGRSTKQGQAIVQTHYPNNLTIINASKQDYSAFYKEEMQRRKIGYYPPYCNIASFTVMARTKEKAYKDIVNLKEYINENYDNSKFKLLGPSSPLLGNEQNKYKFKIVLKYDKTNKDYIFNLLNDVKNEALTHTMNIKFNTNSTQNI